MSFKAKFIVDGNEMDVLHCNYSLNQNTDFRSGKPSSEVMGGTINLELESKEDSALWEWAIDPHMKKSGSIKFYKIDEDSAMKELEFEDAFLTGYSESMDARSNNPMTENITISAKKITINGASLDNKWEG